MATYTKKSNFADNFNYTEKTVAGFLSSNKIKLNVTSNDAGSSKNIVFAARSEQEVLAFIQAANASTTQTAPPVNSGLAIVGSGANKQVEVDLTKFSSLTSSTSINSLTASDSINASFWYAVKETNGTFTYAQSTLKIAGVNDAAVISGIKSAALVETDTVLTTSGKLNVVDPDANQAFFNPINSSGKYGTLDLRGSGAWTYSTNSANDQFVQGVNYQDNFIVSTIDGTQTTVTITITGTNDVPIFNTNVVGFKVDGQVTEDGTATTPTGSQTATGSVKATDLDGTSLTYTTDTPNGNYGYFSVNQNGNWKYVLNNYAAQSLGANDLVTETLNIKVTDAFGASIQQVVTVTVQGSNDAPIITSKTQPGYVTEDAPTKAGAPITATGQIMAKDVDASDVLDYSLNGPTGSVTSLDGDYGVLKIDASTGKWTYTLDKAKSQALALGETVVEKFTVVVADANGGSVKDEVRVQVAGTNDAPVIDVMNTSANRSLNLSDTDPSVTGTIVATDVDHGAVLQYAADNPRGQYGSLQIDRDSGAWTYTLDERANSLGANKSVNDTIAVVIRDDKGASVNTKVVITLSGTNHAPTITSGPQTVDLNEDSANNGMLMASGQFAAQDPDHQKLTFQAVADPSASYLGNVTFSGNQWKFVSFDAPGIQALAQGETLKQIWSVTATDGDLSSAPETLTVNIIGANDAPVFLENSSDFALEIDKTSSTASSGIIEVMDVDRHLNGTSDALSLRVQNSDGQYGKLVLDTNTITNGQGTFQWSYQLDEGFATSNAGMNLTAGKTYTDRFVVEMSDGITTINHEIMVTIHGTNDGPVVTQGSELQQMLDEDSTDPVFGQLVVQSDEGGVTYGVDPDAKGMYGSLSIDEHGRWTYILDNSLTQFLAEGEQIIDTATVILTDSVGLSSLADIEVTITGSNDGPVIDRVALAGETSVTVTASDVDSPNYYLGIADVDGLLTQLISTTPIDSGFEASYAPTQQDTLVAGQLLVVDNSDLSLAATADAGLYLGLGTGSGDTINAAEATSKVALYGFGGDDTLTGSKFADVLVGGEGNDKLSGGAGNDRLYGGAGADTLNGGLGKDVFVYTSATDSTKAAMDTIVGFGLLSSSTAASADKIDIYGNVLKVSATASAGVNGADVGVIKSHYIDANGLIKFGSTDNYTTSSTSVTASNWNDVVNYLNKNLTIAGSTVAFTGTSPGLNHTWVYTSDGSSTSNNDFIVDLVGVTADGVTTSSSNSTAAKLVAIA